MLARSALRTLRRVVTACLFAAKKGCSDDVRRPTFNVHAGFVVCAVSELGRHRKVPQRDTREKGAMPTTPVAKYPRLQRPSRRFARYAARTERAALTDASAPGEALS
jgi:hypothetical protein